MAIDNASDAEIVARYLRKGVIWQLPAKPAQRQLLLEWLVKRIPPNRIFSETEINTYLGGHNIDHVTLRRLLVDHGLIDRNRTGYWRVVPDTTQES
jgi:hypothetical protein